MARRRALETLVSPEFWRGRKVFLTGHTGFKGSWLTLWLSELGADVTGFALPAEQPSLFEQAGIAGRITHIEGDIRDLAALETAIAAAAPEIVFHLAAQPLVRQSYVDPVGTFATNVQGTVHLLDACRRVASLRAIVCVTSDKCYENQEWVWPYRESDPMGGFDPYSSSKGAAELVISAYRRSFFTGEARVASVRAGNVIGGGDWATDRLIPDIVRALIAGKAPEIRSPDAVRPWQHVFEALSGYLLIAARLAEGQDWAATAWNFGPSAGDTRPVGWIVNQMLENWGMEASDTSSSWVRSAVSHPHEAHTLKLDCTKARAILGWLPTYDLATTIGSIVAWHRSVAEGGDAKQISLNQLNEYRGRLARTLSGSLN